MSVTPAQLSFQTKWRIGRRVQTVAAPHRIGTIRFVLGTGQNARIYVNLFGHPPQSFSPVQLTPL